MLCTTPRPVSPIAAISWTSWRGARRWPTGAPASRSPSAASSSPASARLPGSWTRAPAIVVGGPTNAFGFVFLTAQSDEALFEEAVALGVKGYVLKECASSDVAACVRAVASGGRYISPALMEYLISGRAQKPPVTADLTAAEMRVLRLIGE